MSPEADDQPGVDVTALDRALSIWDKMQRPDVARSTRGTLRRSLVRLLEAAYGRQCLSCRRTSKGAKRVIGDAHRGGQSNRIVLAQRSPGRPPIIICRSCAVELGYPEVT